MLVRIEVIKQRHEVPFKNAPPSSVSLKSSEELEAIDVLTSLHSASTSSKKRAAPSSTGDSEEPSSKKTNTAQKNLGESMQPHRGI